MERHTIRLTYTMACTNIIHNTFHMCNIACMQVDITSLYRLCGQNPIYTFHNFPILAESICQTHVICSIWQSCKLREVYISTVLRTMGESLPVEWSGYLQQRLLKLTCILSFEIQKDWIHKYLNWHACSQPASVYSQLYLRKPLLRPNS